LASDDVEGRTAGACPHGRLHHVLTQTPRGLRRACRIGGKSLIEVDVANAQPAILGTMVIAATAQAMNTNQKKTDTATKEGRRRGRQGGRGAPWGDETEIIPSHLALRNLTNLLRCYRRGKESLVTDGAAGDGTLRERRPANPWVSQPLASARSVFREKPRSL